ncbi:MAG: TrmH family RNA methyltransferase [Saezia sp.]
MIIKEVTSRQNPLVKEIYQLSRSHGAYQQAGKIWLEGEHLCQAYLEKNGAPEIIVCSKSAYDNSIFADLIGGNQVLYVLEDSLFQQVSHLESMGSIGYLISLPSSQAIQPKVNSIILDRLQDPGNVGSILRSAAAFGFQQVIALKGTCALWGGKTLRAGMGSHFSLNLLEHVELADLESLELPMLATSSHSSLKIHQTDLPYPCAWIFGHEGQGVQQDLLDKSKHIVCIEQPGGEESLNAAIAASICMYETVRQHSK